MRIAISLMEDEGKDSKVAEHPGNAKFIAVYDSNSKSLEVKPIKQIEGCAPILTLMESKADAFYCFELGMRAEKICREKGIRILTGKFKFVKEVMENLGELEELEKGCGH